MPKIKFNPEINIGHLLMFIGFIAPAVVYGVAFTNDFKNYKAKVDKHEAILEKIAESQKSIEQNTAVMSALLKQHMEDKK